MGDRIGEQTGLRPLRRRFLAGTMSGAGVLGARIFAPWILQPVRAASGRGDGTSPDAGAGQRDATPSGDQPRAVLYEEDPNDRVGKKFPGSAQWTLVEKPNESGAVETAVRASVAIPERRLVMALTLRRNDDRSLPASHVVEFIFTLPPDAPRRIGNVPGVLMKSSEQARGIPLKGVSVKVTDGYYLIGLSTVDDERAANMSLLMMEDWFDVPIVYSDGHRAILAFEKGELGRRLLAQAFAAWGASTSPASPQSPPSLPPSPLPPKKLQLPPDIIK